MPLPLSNGQDNEDHDTEYQAEFDRRVYRSQTSAYWAGRFMSLNDRLMNTVSDVPPPGALEEKLVMQANELARYRKAFAILDSFCETIVARKSLKVKPHATN